MQTLPPPVVHDEHPLAHRRPRTLDVVAGLLVAATVVLHVVAMFPSYYSSGGSLTATADQAAEYALLAAAWALVLGIGLTGPHRTPVAAGLAVGLAAGELGFRVYDVGEVFRYGAGQGGVGLWLMTSAWAVGAAAAVAACFAAHSRHRPAPVTEAAPSFAPPPVDWAARPEPLHPPLAGPADPTVSVPVGDPTRTDLGGAGHAPLPTAPSADDAHERWAWTVLVAVLAAVVAGAFLPSWDKYSALRPSTGQSVSTTVGNAFSGPWQQVVGNVIVGVVLLVLPIVAVRFRHKAAAAAAVCGALLVLTTQLLSAVVSVGEPVPPQFFGLSPAQARSLGVELSLRLTGWFTVDALAAYALFAAVMIWATLRVQSAPGYANSPGGPPSAPLAHSPAMPPSS